MQMPKLQNVPNMERVNAEAYLEEMKQLSHEEQYNILLMLHGAIAMQKATRDTRMKRESEGKCE